MLQSAYQHLALKDFIVTLSITALNINLLNCIVSLRIRSLSINVINCFTHHDNTENYSTLL
jgi:hypothetical protein